MYRPQGEPQRVIGGGSLGESGHLALMRRGQAEQRMESNMDTGRYAASAAMQRSAGDMHHAQVQAERRALMPMTQAAVEAVTNSSADPRVAQVLQGAKQRALLNIGAGEDQQRLVELGAQAAGGIRAMPV